MRSTGSCLGHRAYFSLAKVSGTQQGENGNDYESQEGWASRKRWLESYCHSRPLSGPDLLPRPQLLDHQLWIMVLTLQSTKEENGGVIGIKF